jgi:hypothetical protein
LGLREDKPARDDLVKSSAGWARNRSAKHYAANAGPDDGAHAHRARFSRGVEDHPVSALATVLADIIVDCVYLAMEGRIARRRVYSRGHDGQIGSADNHGAEREAGFALPFVIARRMKRSCTSSRMLARSMRAGAGTVAIPIIPMVPRLVHIDCPHGQVAAMGEHIMRSG